ncbi:MAG: formylglycine-generating enzyme family protein [Betaproteobacteria bacterium]|nr:formylglycine-generating enzyme family protein [Betaproteobacteria bacterium]
MDVPGLTVEQVQKRVASGVKQSSRGRQEPWMEGLLEGEFYFRPGVTSADPIPAPVQRPVVATPSADPVEAAYWTEVTKADDTDSYAAYLATYPNGLYVADANEYLERDKRNKAAKAQLKEDQAWREAQNKDSHASYGAYLKAYPAGRYTPLAKLKQSKLRPLVLEPEMVQIPGRNYEMGKYEVTQAQWRSVMENAPSHFKGCDDCPVEQVSWDDVQQYLSKLNQMTGKQYRLPTESEWKHACDGGGNNEYCGSNNLDAVGWYDANSGNKTHPVGQKQANGYGLHDMSGNVWEWQQDCYDGDCSRRVSRGGSWYSSTRGARAAYRSWYEPSNRYDNLGFRPARTLP